MTLEKIREICLALPYTTEDIKWENHVCFCVGGKIFLITSPESLPINASLKVTDEAFENLQEHEGFSPAPYLARYKWIFVDNINRWNTKQWTQFLHQAHQQVYAKLPPKIKKQLANP